MALGPRKGYRVDSGDPALATAALVNLDVENVTPPKPGLVNVVVHLVAQPRRREHLGATLGAQALTLGSLCDTRLDNAGVLPGNLLDGYLVIARIALAQSLILVVCPNDVAAGRTVAQEALKDSDGIAM